MDIRFDHLGPGEYDRAKKILDRARHPAFIGRDQFERYSVKGVVFVAVIDGEDTGITMVDGKGKGVAQSVAASHQGRGIAIAMLGHHAPKFISIIGAKVHVYERCGYVREGPPDVGQSGAESVQLMRLEKFIPGASIGRLVEPKKAQPILVAMPGLSAHDRLRLELLTLDVCLDHAIESGKHDAVLALFARANAIAKQLGER